MNAHTTRVPAAKKVNFMPAHRIQRVPPGAPSAEALHDRIRARAYELYEVRTANGGAVDPESDWLQAELEIRVATPGPNGAGDMEVKTQFRAEQPLGDDD